MNKAKGDERTLLLVKLSSCNLPQETWLLAVKVLQENDYHDEGKV